MSETAEQPTQVVPQPNLRGGLTDDTCEILLIRHGRSADVAPGSPESADPPLHEIGVEQATRLAERLAGKEIHAVASSHLARARQTAAPLAEALGLDVEVFVDLEEVRLGDWSNGELRRRAATDDPEFLAWAATGRWDGIPGGEGDDSLRTRVTTIVESLADRHRGRTVAVVCHGGVIAAYLAHVLGIERSLWMAVENTSVSVVHLGPAGPFVVTANDCHHLYDPVFGPG
ncbi:MAG: histidine phosphatase family protein [Ilumatobacteraceae bacterium]